MIMQARRAAPVLSNEYPSIAERRKLGLYVTYMEVELAERFGEHAARLFLENFGGGELFVPLKATDDHPVSKLVGRDVLEWLITKYGSGAVEVPHGGHVEQECAGYPYPSPDRQHHPQHGRNRKADARQPQNRAPYHLHHA